MFYKGRYIEMLAETYKKFKSQLKVRKTGNEQLSDIVQTSDEQVHYMSWGNGKQRASVFGVDVVY